MSMSIMVRSSTSCGQRGPVPTRLRPFGARPLEHLELMAQREHLDLQGGA
jgi:hypothetical protein